MRSGPHRLLDRHGSPWRLLAIAAAVASLLGPVAIAAAASPMDVPYSSASSGNLEVTLPSAYPDVQLSLVGNQTVAADLAISQILESTPSSSTPQIVAVALPSNVVVTNATGAAQSAGLLFTLTASLTVYPSNAGLWQGPGISSSRTGPRWGPRTSRSTTRRRHRPAPRVGWPPPGVCRDGRGWPRATSSASN